MLFLELSGGVKYSAFRKLEHKLPHKYWTANFISIINEYARYRDNVFRELLTRIKFRHLIPVDERWNFRFDNLKIGLLRDEVGILGISYVKLHIGGMKSTVRVLPDEISIS